MRSTQLYLTSFHFLIYGRDFPNTRAEAHMCYNGFAHKYMLLHAEIPYLLS